AVVITDLVSQIHQRNTQFWPEPVEKLQPQDSRDRTHLEYLSDLKCFLVMQKKLGFLNFGNFGYNRQTGTVTVKTAFDDQLAMTIAAEEEGLDGAWFRVHHFQWMISSPFPVLAAMAAQTSTIELGTGVIDLRYENPLYFAEQAATTDLISSERLQ